jgi:hypothetical protein
LLATAWLQIGLLKSQNPLLFEIQGIWRVWIIG